MERELCILLMDRGTKVSFWIMRSLAMGSTIGMMERFTLDNGSIIK